MSATETQASRAPNVDEISLLIPWGLLNLFRSAPIDRNYYYYYY
jgi:hypothetical protein